MDFNFYKALYFPDTYIEQAKLLTHWIKNKKTTELFINKNVFYKKHKNFDYLVYGNKFNLSSEFECISHYINNKSNNNEPNNNEPNSNEPNNNECDIEIQHKKPFELFDKYSEFISNNFEYLQTVDDDVNIIISLTTMQSRFMSEEFNEIVDSLFNQELKAKFVVINIPKIYEDDFCISNEIFEKKNIIENTYDNVFINICNEDYGSITKILGLFNLEHIFNDDDIIIYLDDNWKMIPKMTLMYKLMHNLYQPDFLCIDEHLILNRNVNVFSKMKNNANKYVFYGWLSFSTRFKFVKQLKIFYDQIDKSSELHDNMILTLFINQNKLYVCGIDSTHESYCNNGGRGLVVES